MKCRAVLIENDEEALVHLRGLLRPLSARVEVVGEALLGPAAVEAIHACRPDMIFLTIDGRGLDAFELLARLEHRPAVIFMTERNRSGRGAFETYKVHYLQRPIELSSVESLLDGAAPGGDGPPSFPTIGRYLSRLPCRVGDRTILLDVGEISYFQSSNKYTSVYAKDRDFLVDTPLVDLEKRLNPREFVRIHRATLVNVAWIEELRRLEDGRFRVRLKDPKRTELQSSRMYAENLRSL
jgi:two-component system LytT family response regulator